MPLGNFKAVQRQALNILLNHNLFYYALINTEITIIVGYMRFTIMVFTFIIAITLLLVICKHLSVQFFVIFFKLCKIVTFLFL